MVPVEHVQNELYCSKYYESSNQHVEQYCHRFVSKMICCIVQQTVVVVLSCYCCRCEKTAYKRYVTISRSLHSRAICVALRCVSGSPDPGLTTMPAMVLFCYTFFSFSLFFVVSALPNSTSIYFSYITTITGAGFRSGGAIPVVDLALEQINNRTDILPNYTLSYRTIHDSKVKKYSCNRVSSLYKFFH